MKALILSSLIALTPLSAMATETTTYNTKCVVTINKIPEIQICQVVENRSPSGSLGWRNVFARNYYIKSWFGPKGLMTKDSIRNTPYKWEYRANRQGYSQVSPELNVHNISWD